MPNQISSVSAVAASVLAGAKAWAEPATLDKAFEALKAYTEGASRGPLMSIDAAVRDSSGDPAAQKALEQRLANLLHEPVSPLAKEYACNKLALIGSSACIPDLAALLGDPASADAARSALQIIGGAEAAEALRSKLPKLTSRQKAGVMNSLGACRDLASVPALITASKDENAEVSRAALAALGDLGTEGAAEALRKCLTSAPESLRPVVANACLACAERLLAGGQKALAATLYEALANAQQPPHVQWAVKKGLER